MVNSQVIKETVDAFKLDLNTESVPNAIPVVEVGIKSSKSSFPKTFTKSTTGSATIYTTPTDQDFYITALAVSLMKDATCDVADGGSFSITAQVNGIVTQLIGIPLFTLTAQDGELALSFGNHPMKVDRGTTILIATNTFSAGKMTRIGYVHGYLDEVS